MSIDPNIFNEEELMIHGIKLSDKKTYKALVNGIVASMTSGDIPTKREVQVFVLELEGRISADEAHALLFDM